jgi:hypothetical protein
LNAVAIKIVNIDCSVAMSGSDSSPLPKFRKPAPIPPDLPESPPFIAIIKRRVKRDTPSPIRSKRSSYLKCKLIEHQAIEERSDDKSMTDNSSDDADNVDESYITNGYYSDGSFSAYRAGASSQAEGFSTPMHRVRHRDKTPLHEILEARILEKRRVKKLATAAAYVASAAVSASVDPSLLPKVISPQRPSIASLAIPVPASVDSSLLPQKVSPKRPSTVSLTIPQMWQKLPLPHLPSSLPVFETPACSRLSFVPGRIVPETPISNTSFRSRTKLLLKPSKKHTCHVAAQTDLFSPQQHHVEIQTSLTLSDVIVSELRKLLNGLDL